MGGWISIKSKEDQDREREILMTMKKSNDIDQEKLELKKKEMDNKHARHMAEVEGLKEAAKCGQADKIREITFGFTALELVHGQGEANCEKVAVKSLLPNHPIEGAGPREMLERGEQWNYNGFQSKHVGCQD